MKRQRGVTTVEFAIIGTLVFIVLFGSIEVARAFFVWNTLAQITERGARLAAVCPVNHVSIKRVAIFSDPVGPDDSPVITGLSTANIDLQYLNEDGAPTAVFGEIRYVRTSITGYTHQLIIPVIMPTVTAPPFTTTLPIESLGWIPEINDRQCFGTA
jgi:hypothetical protein